MYEKLNLEIDALLSKMTIDEKIGQLNQICFSSNPNEIEKIKDLVRSGKVGSLILADSSMAGNDKSWDVSREILDEYQRVAVEESPNNIPLIFGRDVIYGHRTVYPIPLAQSCAFNPNLVEKCYSNVAKEAAVDGIHWTFSPMLDLCRDPRWGRIIESAGEDPFVAGEMAKAVVNGFQGEDLGDGKLVACAKHFIGYGASEAGRDYHHAEISDYSLYNYYLPAFKSAVDSGVGTVMSSFNDINGENVGASRFYMTDILRDYLGFDGFVVSDWGAVEILLRQGLAENYAECAEKCINAGTDMNMVESSYINNLKKLIEEDKVTEETLNLAVKRILRVKMAKHLFEKPYAVAIDFDREIHLKMAKDLAVESMVLLKNNGVLPLKNKKIILSGPFVNERRSLLGSWTLDGKEQETETIYEAFCKSFGKENVLTDLNGNSDIIVLTLGESNKMNGEAHSLADISINDSQKELLITAKATGKKIIGIMLYGRPIALEDTEQYFDAILYAWQAGSKTAEAVCDLLLGKTSPSGRLTVTFPKKTGHIPIYYNAFCPGKTVNAYYNDVWEGHSGACYIDGLAEPMYPFGFGLTYGALNYGEIVAERQELSLEDIKNGEKFGFKINVQNKGDFPVKETVQLYIKDKVASIMRPLKELKGYIKKEILPNDNAEFIFNIGYDELGFYLKNGKYTLEKGEFDIFIGENCLTNRKITIKVI